MSLLIKSEIVFLKTRVTFWGNVLMKIKTEFTVKFI